MIRLVRLATDIGRMVSENRFDDVNKLLQNLDISNEDATYLVAALRYTSILHAQLSDWNSTRDRIKTELDKRNMNSDMIMRGLYTYEC